MPLSLGLFLSGLAGAAAPPPGAATPPDPAPSSPAATTQTVIVRGQRPIDIGPLPGLAVGKDQIPANVQSATKEDIKASRALNLADYLNTRLQGVSTNDYAGNPFQLDVNYRGFTASPQIGTPQGLSVFFDGVRVNEPFGDVVNWDLIPLNAIERFDLLPGSSPIFGLNTLGGALAIHGKSGFTAPGFEITLLGGSWGRSQLQLSGGTHSNGIAGFAAATVFHEDGWRDDSPSRVRQLYARGDLSTSWGLVTAAALAADNVLIGNGVVPLALYRARPETVFTSPDRTANKLLQFMLAGTFDVSDAFNVTARAYHRRSDRDGLNGDAFEEFEEFNSEDVVVDWERVQPDLPICRFEQRADGGVDQSRPLNGPVGVGCDFVRYAPSPDRGHRRNGGFLTGDGTRQEPGVSDGGTPIGLLTRTALHQRTDGLGLQMNWNLERHKLMAGASLDRSRAGYLMSQRLGLIDAAHRVFLDPDRIAPFFIAAFTDVIGNSFDGRQTTASLYFSELWSPRKDVHLTLAARYNRTRTHSTIGTRGRIASDIGDVRGGLPGYIVCRDGVCPDAPVPVVELGAAELTPVSESFRYTSLNPSAGVSWMVTPELNVFANLGRGTRVPSVVELGCALDLTFTLFDPANPALGGAPRSALGAACSLPTTLSGDPFLPQIRSTSGEFGLRGSAGERMRWNASVFRTDLEDDIYFVGVGSGRSYFDTIGRTRRQGFELGIEGRTEALELAARYAFVDASFRSTFYVLSPHNSSADFDQNSRTFFGDPFFGQGDTVLQLYPSATAGENRGLGTYLNTRVDPGARMPGVPAHNFNASVNWRVTADFRLGLTFIARSSAYLRGNENNQHRAAGSDQQIGQYYCVKPSGCSIEGYQQLLVPGGRPFTESGKVPGFGLFNLSASQQLAKGLTLNLLVTNLFDRKYATAGRLGVNPFSPSTIGETGPSGWNYNSAEWRNSSFVGPGSPRAYWLSLEYAFDPR